MKIAIDGPAASGKGTLTKLLAQELGVKYLNTGKLYRVVAFSIRSQNVEQDAIDNSKNFLQFLEKYGESPQIYSQENSILTSKISSILQVRQNLVQFQRDFAFSEKVVILEGRDIGTHILPNADFKFFITATPEERAKRRYNQEIENGIKSDFHEILTAIIKRDEQDSTRENNPMQPAKDAIVIDTTNLSIDNSLKKIINVINKSNNDHHDPEH